MNKNWLICRLFFEVDSGAPAGGGGEPAAGTPTPPVGGGGAPAVGTPTPPVGQPPEAGAGNEGGWYGNLIQDKSLLETAKPTLSKYQTPQDFVKGHMSLLSDYSNKIPKLQENATPEQKIDYRRKHFGAVDHVDKVELKMPDPESVPKGVTFDEDKMAAFKQFVVDNGYTNAEAQQLFDFHNQGVFDKVSATADQVDGEVRALESVLRQEWGVDYDNNLNSIKQMVKGQEGGDHTWALLEASGALRQAGFVKFLHGFSKSMFEMNGNPPPGSGGGSFGNTTASQASAELNKLSNDAEFMKAVWDQSHKMHEANNKKWQELIKLAGSAQSQ